MSDNEKMLASQLNSLHYSSDFHNEVKSEVLEVIKDFRGLKLKQKSYVYPDGRTTELICLEGTIPIFFKMLRYNIPMSIFIPECYPLEAPILYVVPTANMVVRPNHPCVDLSGLITSGCSTLRNWDYPKSNLRDTLGDLQTIFNDAPPLFTRPPNYTPPPPQPVVVVPAPPPRPQPPVVQPRPPQHTDDSFDNPIIRPSGSQGSGSIWDNLMGNQPRPPQPPPVVRPPSVNQAEVEKQRQEAARQELDASFQSTAIIALTHRLKESLAAGAAVRDAEVQKQFSIQAELKRRQHALHTELASLQTQRESIDRAAHDLQTANAALQKWLTDNEPRVASAGGGGAQGDDIHPDSVIVPADELSAEALKAQAADLALEDAMRALDVAFEDGKIPLDNYLRQIRGISRRQFTARALSKKVSLKQQEEMKKRQPPPTAAIPSHRIDGSGGQQQQQQGAQLPIGDLWHTTGGILTNPLASQGRVML